MDFVTGLPRTQRRHDAIWVVVDRLTKSAHFLPIRKDYSVSKLAETFQQEIVRLHGTPSVIVSDRDLRFTSRFRKVCRKLGEPGLKWTGNWDDYICLVEFAYNNSWHASIKCAPFEMLYGRKCRAPICWDQVGERVIEGSKMIEMTNEKVAIAKEKLKEARTRQKSYANKHRRSIEFQPGELDNQASYDVVNRRIKLLDKQNKVVTPSTDPEIEQLAINDELGFVIHLEFGYINLRFRFQAQSIRSSNMIALDSPYLLVLIAGTSQSRQHANPTDPHHTPTIIQPSKSQPQKTKQHRKPRRKVTKVPQPSDPTSVKDEAVNEEMDDSLERFSPTAISLDAEKDRTTKTTQAMEIKSLKMRVKKLERRKRSRTHGLKRLYKVRLSARVKSSEDEDGDEVIVKDAEMLFDVADDLSGEEVFVSQEVLFKEVSVVDEVNDVSTATTTTATIDDITLAKGLIEIKSAKPKTTTDSIRPKAKGLVIHEQEQTPTPIAKINADYELTQRLQAEEQDELTDLDKKRNFFAAKREMFDKAMKRVNTFVDYRTELVEESSKKAKIEITQEGSSKRVGDEMKQERSKKEDLKVIWRFVKARFEKVKPVDHMDSFLLHNLKTIFEHHVEDNVWKNQQGLVKVKNLKLYDSCGVHS
nr:retrotransposable element Tf2 [Tanacetum cinerariifolium]